MGVSSSLLLVAVCAALAPLAITRFRPPASMRDLEKVFVAAVVATILGGLVVVIAVQRLSFFGCIHLLYLLGVVTLPLLLGGWFVSSWLRRTRTLLLNAAGLAAAALAMLGVWATHIEPNWLSTDIVAVAAPVQQPLRVGVLADLQTPNVGGFERKAVTTLIAEEPDIVLIPGDFFQGDPITIAAETPAFVELLETLTANVEVVAIVSGDSDRPGELLAMASEAGAFYIDNEVLNLTVAGQAVRLAGVSVYAASERLDTLAAMSSPSDGLTILLSHRPDAVYELAPGSDVDLIVSGHTHGGQIAVPFFGPLVTLSDVPRDVAGGGLGIVDNYPLYVSTGVGLERLDAPQVRFGVRPSVGVIDIVPE